MPGQDQQQQAAAAVPRHIEVRLPDFIEDDPELWFSQVEMCLKSAGITDEATMHGQVAGRLHSRYAKEARELVVAPQPPTPYTTLKNALIKRFGVSQEQKTKQLLERERIGDRTPSQFLRHLKSLATGVDEAILRALWLEGLPTSVQQILAAHKDVSLEKVAEIADSIIQYSPKTSVSEVQHTSSLETLLHLKMAQLRLDLRDEICSIFEEQNRQPRTRSRGRSNSRARSGRRNSGHDQNGVCWYHQKFGDRSRRCSKPCTFTGNATGPR